MTEIICARNVQAMCNIKPKPWSQMSVPGYGFLVFDLQSWIPDPGSWSQVSGSWL